ncbi:MAG: peptide ABC transporter ATP-binding protein, partial [Deltaproteobacteria bacterium]|nr:peptide ABC transporter ATP-binding protein [Deltaproteobacteria bacterium]
PDPAFKTKRIILRGDVPSPINPPSGCPFHPRCHYAQDICKTRVPEYRDMGNDHFVTCHFADTFNLKPLQF